MTTKRFVTLRLLVLILGIGLISNMSSAPSDAQGQTPIAREGLLKSLSRKVLSSSELVDQVKQRGVDFQLTPTDEQEIRRTGKYLRTKGLNSLVAAVRNNYRPHVSRKPTPTPSPASITQIMTNSPGGIQAGRDVIINPKPEPRSLTQVELDRMDKLLRPHKGHKLFMIRLGDREANLFASQILQTFQAAGWQVSIADIGQQVPPVYGLRLGVPDPQQLPPQAVAIYSSFENTATPATVTDLSRIFPLSFAMRVQAENGIVLHVGLKPVD